MYIVLALVMLARGVIEAVLMRVQQAVGLGGGFLSRRPFRPALHAPTARS